MTSNESVMRYKIEGILQRLEQCNGYKEGGDVWLGPAIGEIRDALARIKRSSGHIVDERLGKPLEEYLK